MTLWRTILVSVLKVCENKSLELSFGAGFDV